MISLFGRRRTLAEAGIFAGMTDWHSHILPGVDDGLESIGDSLRALREYEALGIREVWLTPHVMEDMPNTTEGLRERFAELRAAYGGPVELHLAAEYMMDSLLGERLRSGDLLPLGPEGRHLLVETSYFNPPARLGGILDSVRSSGYYPVLAHPERYLYMDMKDYDVLTASGAVLQLNLPSLTGMYGSAVRKRALRLLRAGLYTLAGTDLHRTAQAARLASERCLDRTAAGCLSALVKNLNTLCTD